MQNPISKDGVLFHPEIVTDPKKRVSCGGASRLYAFWILPDLMQLVHTRMRFGAPLTTAFTACRFTFQRRLVTLCACEILLPNCGPLPQTSHTCAISIAPNLCVFPRQPSQFPTALIRSGYVSNQERAMGRMKTHPPCSLPNIQYTLKCRPGQMPATDREMHPSPCPRNCISRN